MPQATRKLALHWLLIPLAALIAVAPECLHGPSCGHDFVFHLQGWMDAAAQLRHAHWPRWSTTSAWHAGEPRFTFYPPLSWLLGAALTMLLPPDAVPVAFTFLALTGAGLAMFHLARTLNASRAVAAFAACLYLANPYLLFNGYERTAFAELLAAGFFPLLIAGVLRRQLSATRLALPLAALWLTNAPSGIMGSYVFALVVLCRLARPAPEERRWPLLRDASVAGALGIGIASFYLLPVVAERKLIQVSMAELPAMNPAGNFLFGRLGDPAHDQVLHTASLIAVVLLAVSGLAFAVAYTRNRDGRLMPLQALAAVILLLMTPLSKPFWRVLPELALLQFPWRLLSILGCVAAAAIAVALSRSVAQTRRNMILVSLGSVIAAALLSTREAASFRQGCEADDSPHRIAALLRSGHGYPPTDEYTPASADNSPLRFDSPGWWLASPSNPDAPGPNTVPNPAEQNPDTDFQPSDDQTVSGEAPQRLDLRLSEARVLVFNLRDWPAWQVMRNGAPVTERLHRTDGLLALWLPPGVSGIDLSWRTPPIFYAGDVASLAALACLWVLARRQRLGAAKLPIP